MAYKDEYEVARLFTNGDFEKRLREAFEGEFTVTYHLAPPLFAKRDSQGHLVKAQYGAWMGFAFRCLARFRRLRGTFFDPFGHTAERKMERRLIRDYQSLLEEMTAALSPGNHDVAVALASLPERMRGFGHVKQRNIEIVETERERLLARFRALSAAIEHAA
jgi:indolepyruvate ferredoxin oxidoreductase